MNDNELRLLRRINAEAWGKYGDRLFVEREKAGTMKKVIDLALTKEKNRFDAETLDKLQNIKDSGMLEGTEKVEDPKIASEMEKYVEGRIAEEIKKGNLREPDKAFKKAKQYANKNKRNHARSN